MSVLGIICSLFRNNNKPTNQEMAATEKTVFIFTNPTPVWGRLHEVPGLVRRQTE